MFQKTCQKYLEETCTDPLCDFWNPPECKRYETKEVAARDVLSNILSLWVLSPLQYHLSLIDEEWTYNDSTGNLHKLRQIPVHCLCKFTIGLAFASRNFCKLLCSFLVKFCFACVAWYPLSGNILYSHRISVIVARFTVFVGDLVVGP